MQEKSENTISIQELNQDPNNARLRTDRSAKLISESLVVEDVADIFKIAGLEKLDISILSEEFLKEVDSKMMPKWLQLLPLIGVFQVLIVMMNVYTLYLELTKKK